MAKMDGVEMIAAERLRMLQRQRLVQISEGEGKERREQQRLWYRRRRSQMTEQEIAYQNEQRRMRYRLKRLKASAAPAARATYDHPVLAMEGGENSRSYNEKAQTDLRAEWISLTTRGSIDLHDTQQEFRYLPQRWQLDDAAQVRGNGVRRHHWRWKVEARRGRGEMAMDPPSALSLLAKASSEAGEDTQSDDSESTETDESVQGVLSPSCFASFGVMGRPADDDPSTCPTEVTSKARTAEDTAPPPSTVQRTMRLSRVKQQARALCKCLRMGLPHGQH